MQKVGCRKAHASAAHFFVSRQFPRRRKAPRAERDTKIRRERKNTRFLADGKANTARGALHTRTRCHRCRFRSARKNAHSLAPCQFHLFAAFRGALKTARLRANSIAHAQTLDKCSENFTIHKGPAPSRRAENGLRAGPFVCLFYPSISKKRYSDVPCHRGVLKHHKPLCRPGALKAQRRRSGAHLTLLTAAELDRRVLRLHQNAD